MSCLQADWLHGYFDGELDAARSAEFATHLVGCVSCRDGLAREEGLRAAFLSAGLYVRMPEGLKARVRADLPRRRLGMLSLSRLLTIAAAAVVAFIGLWLAASPWRGSSEAELSRQVLDAHLRALQLTHLTDVASTDQHTVKPWFVGKLDFAPPVVDLEGDGFPLVGGRLDVVSGKSVAALVYGRRKHVIDVFVWTVDGNDVAAAKLGALKGYNFVRWTKSGMRFWAISDVAPAELEKLAGLMSR
jgi:anti-sigma factor RsiW